MRRFGLALALLLSTATVAPAYADDPIGAVSGVWFFDRNQDGLQQPDEPGAQKFSVELLDHEGKHVTSIYTDGDGHYNIGELAPGEYTVVFKDDGFVATTPHEVPVTITEGNNANVGFGMCGGEISGTAWEDTNGDGQRQDDEPRLGGVPVRLVSAPIPVGYTNQDGTYRIPDLRIADYPVYFEIRDGMTFAPPLVGNSGTDSDVVDFDEGIAHARIWIGRPGIINATSIDVGYVPAS